MSVISLPKLNWKSSSWVSKPFQPPKTYIELPITVAEWPKRGTGISPYSATCEIWGDWSAYLLLLQVNPEQVVVLDCAVAASEDVQVVLELHQTVV